MYDSIRFIYSLGKTTFCTIHPLDALRWHKVGWVAVIGSFDVEVVCGGRWWSMRPVRSARGKLLGINLINIMTTVHLYMKKW
jgi:hypothetical protein